MGDTSPCCADIWALLNYSSVHPAAMPESSLNISHQSWDPVVEGWQAGGCEAGEGWNKSICGQRAGDGVRTHDRSISPTALQFVVWLSLPFIGHGLTRWPTGERWAKAWGICLGSNEAVVTASLGCLRGTNAFITVVPFGGWATISRFFSYFIYFGDSRRINEMLKFTGSISCRARNWSMFL